jgi:TatD DNase family protein
VIDFHCHLDLFDNPEHVAAQCEEEAVYVLSVTTTPKAWRKTSALGKNRRYIRTALGLHPQLAHVRFHELPLFEALLDETRYVGEIGLDGSPSYRPHADIQLKVFEGVLAAACGRGGRIFTIHSRGAAETVLSVLQRHRCCATAVLHWFSGTQKELQAAASLGCWFSVGPAMLRSEKGRQLVGRMPRESVLTETDGPFAQLGKRPLSPRDVRLAIVQLASLWKISELDVEVQLNKNLKELLSRVPELNSAHG